MGCFMPDFSVNAMKVAGTLSSGVNAEGKAFQAIQSHRRMTVHTW
jgi:hypothetical protein